MRLVGRKKALEMVLTGEIMSAQEAYELGLVNKVVPDDKLEESTLELANVLASKSPLALEAGKVGIYEMSDLPYPKACRSILLVSFLSSLYSVWISPLSCSFTFYHFKKNYERRHG